jgi:transcriptional regulator with XRE-family HTH domain
MSSPGVLLLADVREALRSGAAERLRREAHLSQAEVAAELGVSPSAVSRWEAGDRLPRGRAARRYARLLAALEERLSEKREPDLGRAQSSRDDEAVDGNLTLVD